MPPQIQCRLFDVGSHIATPLTSSDEASIQRCHFEAGAVRLLLHHCLSWLHVCLLEEASLHDRLVFFFGQNVDRDFYFLRGQGEERERKEMKERVGEREMKMIRLHLSRLLMDHVLLVC